MSDWAGTLLSLLLESSLRITLIAGAVTLILAAFRARTNGIQQTIWTAVMLMMLLMPALPFAVSAASLSLPLPKVAPLRIPEIPNIVGRPVGGTINPAATARVIGASQPEVRPGEQARPSARTPVPVAAVVVYGVGVLALLLRLAAGWFGMQRLAKAASPILPDAYESATVATPMTIALVKPRIILPTAWRSWPELKLRAVLAHESAHIRRRDPLIAFLARLNCTLFWFHPLAWWLERKLAAGAELACDDAALLAVNEPRQYAQMLLEMAQAVRRRRGRLSWNGVGVSGNGLLGERIERILGDRNLLAVSGPRKAAVGLMCAAVCFIAVACSVPARPSIAEEQRALVRYEIQHAQQQHMSLVYQTVLTMLKDVPLTEYLTPPQAISDLEARLAQEPDDLATREELLTFYSPYLAQHGYSGNNPNITLARRRQVRWIIEHRPDYECPALLFYSSDSDDYAEEKAMWLAQSEKPGASAAVLGNAAYFLELRDRPAAERLILRARSLDPQGPWPIRLARIYALSLVGASTAPVLYDEQPGRVMVNAALVSDAHGRFVQDVRAKLTASTDPALLSAAGQDLFNKEWLHLDFDTQALAVSYLQRAIRLNPNARDAQDALAGLVARDEGQKIQAITRSLPATGRYDAVSRLPESTRFDVLWHLTGFSLSYGSSWDTAHQAEASAAWEESRKYASDLVRLASHFRSDSRYGAAILNGNLALSFVELKSGSRDSALRYLRDASKAPDLGWDRPAGPWTRVCSLLLDAGNREEVLAFIERLAQIDRVERDELLASAAEIRNGSAPHWYRTHV